MQFYKQTYLKGYQLVSAIAWELMRYDISIKFLEKQIECIKSLFPKTSNPLLSHKYRLLAIYLQDYSNSLSNEGKDASKFILQSKEHFHNALASYTDIIGEDHWYCHVLKSVIAMFDGTEESATVNFL